MHLIIRLNAAGSPWAAFQKIAPPRQRTSRRSRARRRPGCGSVLLVQPLPLPPAGRPPGQFRLRVVVPGGPGQEPFRRPLTNGTQGNRRPFLTNVISKPRCRSATRRGEDTARICPTRCQLSNSGRRLLGRWMARRWHQKITSWRAVHRRCARLLQLAAAGGTPSDFVPVHCAPARRRRTSPEAWRGPSFSSISDSSGHWATMLSSCRRS